MDGSVASAEGTVPFENPGLFLAELGAEDTGNLIACATDVALIIEDGVIRDVALGNDELTRGGFDRSWRDKRWIETVTIESRPKIEDLLRGPAAHDMRWRQVNHPSVGGTDLPVRYTTVRVGSEDRLLALGRDLRATARLQQRLVEAHQSLERDYSRLRRAEARYRLLFDTVSQPLLVVDPTTMQVEEANAASAELFGRPAAALEGASVLDSFAVDGRDPVSRAIGESVNLGTPRTARSETHAGHACRVSASAFRGDDGALVIVRVAAGESEHVEAGSENPLLAALEELPDGLVVTDRDLRIVAANRAFVEMAGITGAGAWSGRALSELLGRSSSDVNVLVSSLRNHGFVRNFATVLRNRFGDDEDVELSAVATPETDTAAYGFSIRSVARRLRVEARDSTGLPSSVEQLTGLVGRLPLREIVRQSTDFIEKLCIEAALEITDDNRASAAEMLGLSRQGLYSKLRRFGVDDSR